ncbi:MAG TPA: T9SS type A sorting domain-containing protein [Candidatus Kapabacteria bacterium]|nr:T9SS type A sorting domain-containing protein [Candidatus Kapabacteria bacterium]
MQYNLTPNTRTREHANTNAHLHSKLRFRAMITLAMLAFSALTARAQVAYNFQPPDVITIAGAPVALTMDCLAANGYGQWTYSNATGDAHLLSNKLSATGADDPQDGILSSTAFNFDAGDSYPTSGEIKAVANLQGNNRYVWLQRETGLGSTDKFYVEGFNPGNPGVDISFSALPGDASIVKGSPLGGPIAIIAGHHVVSAANEVNPLDRFDAATDGSNVYIVWEEYSAGAYTLWCMVVSTSGATVLGATELTDPNTGLPMNGQRPTIAVDVRHSGSIAPFDISFISGGSVYWTEWNPSTSLFSSAVAVPTAYIDPYDLTTQNWTTATHARILVASQAGVGTPTQRGIYIIAENPHSITMKKKEITAITGPSLFLERIIGAPPAALPQALNEYCDGPWNTSRMAPSPVGAPYPDYPVLDDPLWAFANPYEGANASGTPPNNFNGFHCLYRLDRSGTHMGTAGQSPLMIIPSSNAGAGYCASESSGTAFLDDPVVNAHGVMQYCGAVNQMGIHVHWITSSTHYYTRDKHEFDQNIEENTLMTDECDIGKTTSGVGTSSPELLPNLILTVYGDPTTNTMYTGFGNVVFDDHATLNIGSSTDAGADFAIAGFFKFNWNVSPNWTLNFGAGNTWDYYGNSPGNSQLFGGTGTIIMTGGSEATTATSVGDYVSSITNPVTVNIHGGTTISIGPTSFPTTITATGAFFDFKSETSIPPGTSGTKSGNLTIGDNSSFAKCELFSDDAGSDDPDIITISKWGQFNGSPECYGSGDANYNGTYGSAQNSTVTFTECWFRAGQSGGSTVGHAYLEMNADESPSALTISEGRLSGWSVNAPASSISPWWPISITNAQFDAIQQFGVYINEGNPFGAVSGCFAQLYSILIDGNDFMTYNLTNHSNPDGIIIEGAPDVSLSDALRESITVTNNIFEGTGTEAAGSVEAAIHFKNTTGDIGYNTIETVGPPQVGAAKYQSGIWNESASETTPQPTWSLICSNTIYGLTNTGAAGLSTDYYKGYAKLNSITGGYYGHLGGYKDNDNDLSSTYTGNASYGYDGTSNSITDMAGVHHPSDHSSDVAAYNVLTGNNSSNTQISLSETATIFLGLEPTLPGWPLTSPYGLNNIQGTPDICGWSGLNLGDISNNYWGGGAYSLCAGTTASGSYLMTAPGSSGFSCSGGLITYKKSAVPQSITDLPDSTCGTLFGLGYELAGDPSAEPAGYDTLRLFIENCPMWEEANGANSSVEAFNFIDGAVSAWSAGGAGRWPGFLAFLKQVLYLNPDTAWYCNDVGDMLEAEQNGGAAANMATSKYILESGKCPEFAADFANNYNVSSKARHQAWLDSLRNIFDSTYGSDYFWPDSIGADTMRHPFDSTIPSLWQDSLEILLGPQYANAVQPNSPITSQALLNATLLDNPMQDEIDISFEMGRTALITMELRDILGRTVPLTYANYQYESPGTHEARIPAPNLPPGTYYLRISTDVGDVITLKVVKE